MSLDSHPPVVAETPKASDTGEPSKGPSQHRKRHALVPRRVKLALVGLAVLALVGGAVTLLLRADAHMVQQRTVFGDANRMAGLQQAHVDQQGGQGLPLTVQPGESAKIGGKKFSPSKGNTVRVTVNDSGFCIRVRSQNQDLSPAIYDSGDIHGPKVKEGGGPNDPLALTPGGACG
jgi:hypothetical protein